MKSTSFVNEIRYVLLNKSDVCRCGFVIITKKNVKTLSMRLVRLIRTDILTRAIMGIRMLDTRAYALKTELPLQQLKLTFFTRPVNKNFTRNEVTVFPTTHISTKDMIIFATNVTT